MGDALKILYGIQGTGNGHLTRARIMAPALKAAGIEVQYLFSGRRRQDFFDMEGFGDWWWRRGLTFVSGNGRISHLRTLLKAPDMVPFLRDVAALDLSGFNLVLNDFEPVSAWAGQAQGIPVIGMGHQQAFHHGIPKCRGGWLARLLLRWYAPARTRLGLHWHPFGQPVLPPLVEPLSPPKTQANHILVYLPFEPLGAIRDILMPFSRWRFKIYHGDIQGEGLDRHLSFHPFSRAGFQHDLATARGVICNSGFELISEALAAGKKILTKPLAGQWEQCCNARALRQLGWGSVMRDLNARQVDEWLGSESRVKIDYPNVAREIATWLKNGHGRIGRDWIRTLWRCTLVNGIPLQIRE